MQRKLLYKKREDTSFGNCRPNAANREKVIINIQRSDFDRNPIRVVIGDKAKEVSKHH